MTGDTFEKIKKGVKDTQKRLQILQRRLLILIHTPVQTKKRKLTENITKQEVRSQ
jgi:hypothetical protein